MKPKRDIIFAAQYYHSYYKVHDKCGESALTVGRYTGEVGTLMRNIKSETYALILEKGRLDALERR